MGDGPATTGQPVEKRGLAYVWPSDDGHDRGHGISLRDWGAAWRGGWSPAAGAGLACRPVGARSGRLHSPTRTSLFIMAWGDMSTAIMQRFGAGQAHGVRQAGNRARVSDRPHPLEPTDLAGSGGGGAVRERFPSPGHRRVFRGVVAGSIRRRRRAGPLDRDVDHAVALVLFDIAGVVDVIVGHAGNGDGGGGSGQGPQPRAGRDGRRRSPGARSGHRHGGWNRHGRDGPGAIAGAGHRDRRDGSGTVARAGDGNRRGRPHSRAGDRAGHGRPRRDARRHRHRTGHGREIGFGHAAGRGRPDRGRGSHGRAAAEAQTAAWRGHGSRRAAESARAWPAAKAAGAGASPAAAARTATAAAPGLGLGRQQMGQGHDAGNIEDQGQGRGQGQDGPGQPGASGGAIHGRLPGPPGPRPEV
ncbi:hypothetical protein DMR_31330 [Solidesulfovibrio magneticus RS-1]|uniref:Uncharacterized protein n=1 Tax=Solidesulfovibrio magneticus (strain ATCC 700980 / DSM 13731 / RS-1) TaxID=573370 RepID=C4XIQ7_SOLM1|nr:hypothetical protein DMR_31330 [Solidesulfovibrio magneticus RS-1]